VTVRVLDIAEHEAREAAFWYDDQTSGLGDDFLDEYVRRLEEIEASPERFPLLETNETEYLIRRAILRRFPYAIIYQVVAEQSVVLAIMHLSRRPDYWVNRLQ
jgi:mRNA-degrading endonuclease RelE of RelBE toxin-antitoxin system